MSAKIDQRIVCAVTCGWWDSIDEIGITPDKYDLPCCPYCGSVLFEFVNEAAFVAPAEKYEKNGHPGYVVWLLEHRGKCNVVPPRFDGDQGQYKHSRKPND